MVSCVSDFGYFPWKALEAEEEDFCVRLRVVSLLMPILFNLGWGLGRHSGGFHLLHKMEDGKGA